MEATLRRRGRTPGFLFTALSAALVVLIAALAITASHTPPPAIAELAPQAERITEAPPEQASELGTADGGAGIGGGAAVTTTTTLAPASGVLAAPKPQPRLRRCVGSPPRQTEDPQSPPCVASWPGDDNGGATSTGVTSEEIRVAVPTPGPVLNRTYQALQAHFNARYELYGRKLRLIPLTVKEGFSTDCPTMKAEAVQAAEQIQAFASLAYTVQRGAENCYYDELARRGVMSMQMSPNGPPSGGEAHMERFAPYQWNYVSSLDKIQRFLGELVCKSMVGRAPVHAAGAQRAAFVRKFGLLREVPRAGAPSIDSSIFETAARACGAPVVVVEQDTDIPYQDRFSLATQAVLRFKDEGVTTVICLCDASYLGHHMINRGTVEAYYPEWVVQDYQAQDQESQVNNWDEIDQKTQVFGVRTWNKPLPREQSPYWMALRESDPTIPPEQYVYTPPYWDLLVLASGIQAAGPKLTPQAFQSGLFRTVFPNPGCGGPPLFQACVGFGPHNHTMIQDGTLIWYSAQTAPRDTDPAIGGDTTGGYCFVDGGRRYRAGQWPSGDRAFFQGPCA